MIPLRVRSYYSLMRGTAPPGLLCHRAKRLGYTAMALTDRDNLYGLWEFLRGCRQQGLRPIVGAEVSEAGSPRIVTCLVKNSAGYRNLCRLLSARANARGSFQLSRDLPLFADGLLLLCSDIVLLERYCRLGADVAADLSSRPSASGLRLRDFALRHNLPAIATPDSSLATAADQELYALLQAVREGACWSECSSRAAAALEAIGTYKEAFAVWPEAVDGSDGLALRCGFSGPEFGVVMPPWRGDTGKSTAASLREKAYRGARRRYGNDLGEDVIERLEHELKVICQMGFATYFLVVRDIVHRRGRDGGRKKRRICGRGSGAASLVAYCLEITNVCPLKYNLYFERFLNPGRSDPPDIDIDFSWDERDEVLNEVLHDFAGHAAMVCNHVFFQLKMAIRETAKTFGLPGHEISRVTKKISHLHRVKDQDLKHQLESLPALKDQDLDHPWSDILRLAAKLVGVPRYISVHPGGVVITPEPIDSYVPVEMAAKGIPVIQWEKDATEEAGLVKIDLLGNRSLGVVRDCIEDICARGAVFNEEGWRPEEDQRTRLTVANGETMGCFYIESPAMRLLEKKAGTGDFAQLVIQSSIIRPAANEFVREYVRRLHGGRWTPLCPEIGDVLDETFGLMVYQEDVSKVAVALAGFSHAEADGLRKIMSKKDREHRLGHYKKKFFAGCSANNIEADETRRMWAMMMSFDGYSFCKPHSASYARVSFQAAYLKAHFPAHFMAAVISNQGGYYSTFAYVSEAKRLGLKILPPDVRDSAIRWKGEGQGIRVGLQSIAGVSGPFVVRLVAARKRGPFAGVEDFFRRTSPADNEARALIHAGALDGLQPQPNRTVLLWQWAAFQRDRSRVALLFTEKTDPPSLPPPDLATRLRREYRVLGFLCSHHPLEIARPLCRLPQVKKSGTNRLLRVVELGGRVGQRVELALWLLTGKLVSTATGEVMEFLTFEDETGQVETTFFPEVYRAHAHLLRTGAGYLVTGLVEEDFGALTLTVSRVKSLMGGQ
ncbi:DNA polymerase III subunit alpha [Desulforhopalus singaporensis]|uniref:DNA polymerase III subunit alpha n=1 Tax=Desulforhopalus singaporensis TaxID=91360 RepID=A0A1H0M4E5_9BACT|nr:DNA polymerase III subunit alpha [Desulforhopalus singaporensis]SDO75086.1 DNA polymerase-3 subunit alpha [Desulforhopalus singaporensis]